MTEQDDGSSGAFNAGPGSDSFGPDASGAAGFSSSDPLKKVDRPSTAQDQPSHHGVLPSSAQPQSPAQPPAYGTPPGYPVPPAYGQPPGYGPAAGYGQQLAYGQPPAYVPPPAYGQPPAYGPPPVYGQPGGYPYGYGMPVKQRTNGLAIASLVLGIVWVYWIGSILALIFGYVSLSQIKKRGDSGHGMAIAGVVLGWVGVAVFIGFIVLLVAVGSDGDFSTN